MQSNPHMVCIFPRLQEDSVELFRHLEELGLGKPSEHFRLHSIEVLTEYVVPWLFYLDRVFDQAHTNYTNFFQENLRLQNRREDMEKTK